MAEMHWRSYLFTSTLGIACSSIGSSEAVKSRVGGELCSQPSECISNECSTDGYCSPHRCKCAGMATCPSEGAPSPDCPQGHLCRHVKEAAVDILHSGIDADLCAKKCDDTPCPTTQACLGTAFCEFNGSWDSPKVALELPARAEVGVPVVLRAKVTSPRGFAIRTIVWTFADSGATSEDITGESVTRAFKRAGEIFVQVRATDERNREASAHGTVPVCIPSGHECTNTNEPCCTPGATCQGSGPSVTCR